MARGEKATLRAQANVASAGGGTNEDAALDNENTKYRDDSGSSSRTSEAGMRDHSEAAVRSASHAEEAQREVMQVVHTVEEANALVKRLRQLENENATLATTLEKVCDENSRLSGFVAMQTEKCVSLSTSLLSETPLLHSLFEPEKTGWFGGSKSAAREQLQQLLDQLQREFVEYRANHASSNDEVQVLIGELQSAHAKLQGLSTIVRTQQEMISHGPLAVAVRIVSAETVAEGISLSDMRHEIERREVREEELRQELRCAREELQARVAETIRQQQELHVLRTSGGRSMEVEQQHLVDEISQLHERLEELTDALVAEEQLKKIQMMENESLSEQLKEMEKMLHTGTEKGHDAATAAIAADDDDDSVSHLPNRNVSVSAICVRCDTIQKECDATNVQLQITRSALRDNEALLAEMREENERKEAELQRIQTDLEEQLHQCVPRDVLAAVEEKNQLLSKELHLALARVKSMEESLEQVTCAKRSSIDGDDVEGGGVIGTLDEGKIIEALQRNKERILRIEIQRDEIAEENKRLREVLAAKEEEELRATRSSQEDKKRINYLLNRCVTMTTEINNITAVKNTLSDEHTSAQLELTKLRRQMEEISTLRMRIEEMRQERDNMQDRLSSVEVLENELVKAKETIAYMELSQSRTINMSQYAELQSKNSKLENTLGPIKKQLEEAQKELQRARTENESLHAVMVQQQNVIKSHEEQTTVLQDNDTKLREKATHLEVENARLLEVNGMLEAQMTNMQDGIKEMAVKLEQERVKAKSAAEVTYKNEITQLQQTLDAANRTLDEVRSTQSAFVPEGIHKSVLLEKERTEEENKRKTFDLDKLKSEIIIYRQTIEDIESENEEHVRQIELLHSTHKKEIDIMSEQLAAEARKHAEFSREVTELQKRLRDAMEREEHLQEQQKKMEDMGQKHRRAFEDKCRQEEKLLENIVAINREMEAQKEIEAQRHQERDRTAAEVAAGLAENIQQLETEVANMREKLQCVEEENSALKLQVETTREKLQCVEEENSALKLQVETTHEKLQCVEEENSALKLQVETTHEKLQCVEEENSALKLQVENLRDVVKSGSIVVKSATSAGAVMINERNDTLVPSDPVVMSARAEEPQMSLTQTQQQLGERRQSSMDAAEKLHEAFGKANDETAALREKVRHLEHELDRATRKKSASATSPARPQKKKNKTPREDLSAVAKLKELQEADVLNIASVTGLTPAYARGLEENQQRARSDEKYELQLLSLREENTQLKGKIASLVGDLQNAESDLELATGDSEKRTKELREQICFLEMQLKSKNKNNGSSRNVTTQQLEERVQILIAENKKLQEEVKALTKPTLGGISDTHNASIARLQMELHALASELLPVKNKLVEYMAMADRLGIHYPFSPEMEGTAVLRLKAMHFDTVTGRVRASSAPRNIRTTRIPHDRSVKTPGGRKRKCQKNEIQEDTAAHLR